MKNQITLCNPRVTIQNGKAITTSQAVAEYFGKQHHHVVQKLESLECSQEFIIRNFSRMIKKQSIGNGAEREVTHYEMTKDGFIFLVMGFTGKKAATFKELYIAEFNRLETELHSKIKPTNSLIHPADIKFINPLDEITMTFNRQEITQLHALFSSFEYMDSKFWPHIKALFPNLNNEYSSVFDTARLVMKMMRHRRQECKDLADLIMDKV